MADKQEILDYLMKSGKVIGVIYSFDKNDNYYDYEFFLADDGDVENTAFNLEIRKMENVSMYQEDNISDAIDDGLGSVEDFWNYKKIT